MTEGFAAVPNWMIRDQRFTRRAILVYISLASRSGPGGIFPSQKTIADEMGMSERTVRTALNELEQLGVIERVSRRAKVGKSTTLTTGYVLHPNGIVSEELAAMVAGASELPATGDVATGNEQQVVPLIEEEPLKKKRPTDLFDEFWAVYPRHVAKSGALAKFTAIGRKGVDLELVVAGARRFAADPNLPEPQFIPYPTTWLNQGRWEDDALPPRRDDAAAVPAIEPGQEWMYR